jgi:hypothetical protein
MRKIGGMWVQRLVKVSVVALVLAGVAAVASGLLALVWMPDFPEATPEACTDPPCFGLDLGGASLLAVLPFLAHLVLIAVALLLGGAVLLLGMLAALRGRGRAALGLGAAAVAGPLLVLVGGEVLPHLANPCVLPDVAGAEPPGFCVRSSDGVDVPDSWHALDHALVGFLPLSLLVAWWWRRRGARSGRA